MKFSEHFEPEFASLNVATVASSKNEKYYIDKNIGK